MSEFEDIEVTGFDDENWEQCQEYSGMRYIPLKLSGAPPRDWFKLWEQCRSRFSHGGSRGTKVRYKVIYLYAGTGEHENYQRHLEELRSRAKETNREYRRMLELEHRAEQAKLEQEREREKQDDELKEKLRSQGLIG